MHIVFLQQSEWRIFNDKNKIKSIKEIHLLSSQDSYFTGSKVHTKLFS